MIIKGWKEPFLRSDAKYSTSILVRELSNWGLGHQSGPPMAISSNKRQRAACCKRSNVRACKAHLGVYKRIVECAPLRVLFHAMQLDPRELLSLASCWHEAVVFWRGKFWKIMGLPQIGESGSSGNTIKLSVSLLPVTRLVTTRVTKTLILQGTVLASISRRSPFFG